VTKELQGDLGELYFKHLCRQRGYGYTKLEDLHRSPPDPVHIFKFGFKRIPVIIPSSMLEEVSRISQPTTLSNGTASYVFDFLTCRLDQSESASPNTKKSTDFTWVEIKTGGSKQSRNQFQTAQTCKVHYSIFRVSEVLASPEDVEIDWEFDSQRFG
jgi:hypothetical protein